MEFLHGVFSGFVRVKRLKNTCAIRAIKQSYYPLPVRCNK